MERFTRCGARRRVANRTCSRLVSSRFDESCARSSTVADRTARRRSFRVCPSAFILLRTILFLALTLDLLLPAAAASGAVFDAASRGGRHARRLAGLDLEAVTATWGMPRQLRTMRNLTQAVTTLRNEYEASRGVGTAGERNSAAATRGAGGSGEGGGTEVPWANSSTGNVRVTTFAKVVPADETPSPSGPAYTVFEVAKPIERPSGAPDCTVTLFTDEPFANTLGSPPTQASYTPDPNCASADWSLAVLSVGVKVKGVQFDRRMVIFFGGFEVSRSITAEPLGEEIHYSFERDVTTYAPILKTASTVYVTLENVVNAEYTGIFNVSITLTSYKGTPSTPPPSLLLPFSSTSSSSSSPFILSGSSPAATSSLSSLPTNVIKAKVELTISMHADDEFYYLYFPNKFYKNLPSSLKPKFKPEGGPFRELELTIDGRFAGAIYPFAPLYTGAFNPLLWSPAVGIGNFGFPTVLLDVTPFAGVLSDGQAHEIRVSVRNAKPAAAWYLTGIVHIWVDAGVTSTAGPPPTIKAAPSKRKEGVKLFESAMIRVLRKMGVRLSIDGKYSTTASRSYSISGTVTSASGPVTTQVSSSMSVDAAAVVAQGGAAITWWNNVDSKISIVSKHATTKAVLATQADGFSFPLKITQTSLDTYGSVKFSIESAYNHRSTLGNAAAASPSSASLPLVATTTTTTTSPATTSPSLPPSAAASSSAASAVTSAATSSLPSSSATASETASLLSSSSLPLVAPTKVTTRLQNSRKDGFTVRVDSTGSVIGGSTSGSQSFQYRTSLGTGCYSRQIKMRPIEVLQNQESTSC